MSADQYEGLGDGHPGSGRGEQIVHRRKGRGAGVAGGYSAEAQAFFARLATQPSTASKARYDQIFVGLKAAGTLAKLDFLYVPSLAPNETESFKNLISASYTATKQGTPYFCRGTGWFGSASAVDYLDTLFNPSLGSFNFTQTNCGFGAALVEGSKVRTQSPIGIDIGSSYFEYYSGDGKMYWRAQDLADKSIASPSTVTGLWIANRENNLSSQLYRNGAQLGTASAAANALPNAKFRLMSVVSEPCSGACYIAFAGAAFTTSDRAALQAAAAIALGTGFVVYGDSVADGTGVLDVATQRYRVQVGDSLFRAQASLAVGGTTLTDAATAATADTEHTGWFCLVWSGHNSPGDVANMPSLATIVAKYPNTLIVLPTFGSGADVPSVTALRASMISTYPSRYVDVMPTLLAHGDGGATDNADIAAGIVPTSLRADAIHMNAAGQALCSPVITAAARLLGF